MTTPTTSTAHDMPMVVHPGYLAGAGDEDTEFDALFAFAQGRDDWSVVVVDDQLVASHESKTGLIILDRAEDSDDPRWIIGYSRNLFRELAWNVSFDARTPAEVVMAVAGRLAQGLAQPTVAERAKQLWSHDAHTGTVEALREETVGTHHWIPSGDLCCTRAFAAPDGTAILHIRSVGEDPHVVVTLRAGARGREDEWWTGEFSQHTPTSLTLAALRTITDPGPYTRRASQIPMAHRRLLRTHPVSRRGPEAARGR